MINQYIAKTIARIWCVLFILQLLILFFCVGNIMRRHSLLANIAVGTWLAAVVSCIEVIIFVFIFNVFAAIYQSVLFKRKRK